MAEVSSQMEYFLLKVILSERPVMGLAEVFLPLKNFAFLL